MTMIIESILQKISTELTAALITNIPTSDPARCLQVKVGRFQENPLDNYISVAISGGDFENPDFIDARIDNPAMGDVRIRNLPVGEIGGGTYWWRRGSLRFQCYFVRQNYDEETALGYAYEFLGRLQAAMENISVSGISDAHEKANNKVIVEDVSFFESGGANKFIWRGKMLWRVLTWRYV